MITLSIFTSQNSYVTFLATIESFFDKCQNTSLIDEVMHMDDRSSQKNRDFYLSLLKRFLPNAKIIKIYLDDKFYDNDSNYLQNYAMICEKFRKTIINSKNKYVFMLEDDWFFYRSFDLKYLSNILEQTVYPQLILTTIVDVLINEYNMDFKKTQYNNFYLNSSKKLYTVGERLPDKNYYWHEVFDYQYFSQNPNLTRIDFFKTNGEFEKSNHFEYEYNKKAALNNCSYNLLSGEPYAYHIGIYKKF